MKKLEPTEIRKAISKLPPMQRGAAEKNYTGNRISWELLFINADELDERLKVTASGKEGIFPMVHFYVNKEEYHPRFRILDENDPIWVYGRIEKIEKEGLKIYLDDVSVSFEKPDEQHSGDMKIGILNTGTGNKFIGNEFDGLDIGIKDEGTGSLAKANKFSDKKRKKTVNMGDNVTKRGLSLISNNPLFTTVVGIILVAIIFYLIDRFTGINLASFS